MSRGEAADRRARRIDAAGAGVSNRQKLHLIAAVLIPVATYVILSQALHSDLVALAITEAIPIAWVLVLGLRKRRVEPIALAAAIVLAAAVLVSIASGGSVLPLKLRRAMITGPLGLACLGSVVVRRPLLPAIMDRLERAWPQAVRVTRILGGSVPGRQTIVLTVIVGVTLLADATAQVTLALSVSTAAFLGASRLARTAVFALGLGVCALYLRSAPAPTPGEQAPGATGSS